VSFIVADIRALEITHGTNWIVADIKTLEIAHGTNWIVADIKTLEIAPAFPGYRPSLGIKKPS